ncbi:hypothetical protein E4T42_01635 [Aureobasidium subglaciale]|nr:hypothetical protein E4T42_01635 [Aureobasidium subglaciale]
MTDQVITMPKPVSDDLRRIKDNVKQITDQYTQSEELVENHMAKIFDKFQTTSQQPSLEKLLQRQEVLEKTKQFALSFIEICIRDLQQRAVSPAVSSARVQLSNIHEFTKDTSLGAIFESLPSDEDSVAILDLLEIAVRSVVTAGYPGVLQVLSETQLAVTDLATSPDRRIPDGSLRKTPRRASTRVSVAEPSDPRGVRAPARKQNQISNVNNEDETGVVENHDDAENEVQDEDATMTTSADEDEEPTQPSTHPTTSMIQDWRSYSDDALYTIHHQAHGWIEENKADKIGVQSECNNLIIDHQIQQAKFADEMGKILR